MSNAVKHAFPNSRSGKLELKLYYDKNGLINLEINDNGVGLKPGIDLRKDSSMGLQIMFQLIEHQLKGQIDYKVKNGLKWHIKISEEIFTERI